MAKAGIVYTGTDDGLVIFSDPGGSGRWRRTGHELRGRAIHALLAQSALDLLAVVADTGLQRSSDGGQSWQPLLAGDIVSLATHHALPNQIFALTRDGTLQRSTDGGATWAAMSMPEPAQRATQIIIPDPQRSFLALGHSVLISTDAGENWSQYGETFPGMVTGLVHSPGRADLLFAVAAGSVYRAGAEATWQAVELLAGGPGYDVVVAMLPGKEEVVLAACSTADSILFTRSVNDGANWQMARVSTPLEDAVTVIAPASYHIDTAWAGTAAGQLLRTSDRGQSWEQLAREAAAIRSLAVVRLA